jgi:hypothetical protein
MALLLLQALPQLPEQLAQLQYQQLQALRQTLCCCELA